MREEAAEVQLFALLTVLMIRIGSYFGRVRSYANAQHDTSFRRPCRLSNDERLQPSPQPNAFATGRNSANSAVAVTEGILQILTPEELEGVLAHELAHIKNRDVLISTMAAIFAGAITYISDMLQWSLFFGRDEEEDSPMGIAGTIAMMILAPIAALLIQMSISRLA